MDLPIPIPSGIAMIAARRNPEATLKRLAAAFSTRLPVPRVYSVEKGWRRIGITVLSEGRTNGLSIKYAATSHPTIRRIGRSRIRRLLIIL
ncbi:MAG TPA: hypothetical protein PLV96_03370 [Methanoregulaceae archaeon]|nr:hypothetical protein [Methanoregulaceae archaeon]